MDDRRQIQDVDARRAETLPRAAPPDAARLDPLAALTPRGRARVEEFLALDATDDLARLLTPRDGETRAEFADRLKREYPALRDLYEAGAVVGSNAVSIPVDAVARPSGEEIKIGTLEHAAHTFAHFLPKERVAAAAREFVQLARTIAGPEADATTHLTVFNHYYDAIKREAGANSQFVAKEKKAERLEATLNEMRALAAQLQPLDAPPTDALARPGAHLEFSDWERATSERESPDMESPEFEVERFGDTDDETEPTRDADARDPFTFDAPVATALEFDADAGALDDPDWGLVDTAPPVHATLEIRRRELTPPPTAEIDRDMLRAALIEIEEAIERGAPPAEIHARLSAKERQLERALVSLRLKELITARLPTAGDQLTREERLNALFALRTLLAEPERDPAAEQLRRARARAVEELIAVAAPYGAEKAAALAAIAARLEALEARQSVRLRARDPEFFSPERGIFAATVRARRAVEAEIRQLQLATGVPPPPAAPPHRRDPLVAVSLPHRPQLRIPVATRREYLYLVSAARTLPEAPLALRTYDSALGPPRDAGPSARALADTFNYARHYLNQRATEPDAQLLRHPRARQAVQLLTRARTPEEVERAVAAIRAPGAQPLTERQLRTLFQLPAPDHYTPAMRRHLVAALTPPAEQRRQQRQLGFRHYQREIEQLERQPHTQSPALVALRAELMRARTERDLRLFAAQLVNPPAQVRVRYSLNDLYAQYKSLTPAERQVLFRARREKEAQLKAAAPAAPAAPRQSALDAWRASVERNFCELERAARAEALAAEFAHPTRRAMTHGDVARALEIIKNHPPEEVRAVAHHLGRTPRLREQQIAELLEAGATRDRQFAWREIPEAAGRVLAERIAAARATPPAASAPLPAATRERLKRQAADAALAELAPTRLADPAALIDKPARLTASALKLAESYAQTRQSATILRHLDRERDGESYAFQQRRWGERLASYLEARAQLTRQFEQTRARPLDAPRLAPDASATERRYAESRAIFLREELSKELAKTLAEDAERAALCAALEAHGDATTHELLAPDRRADAQARASERALWELMPDEIKEDRPVETLTPERRAQVEQLRARVENAILIESALRERSAGERRTTPQMFAEALRAIDHLTERAAAAPDPRINDAPKAGTDQRIIETPKPALDQRIVEPPKAGPDQRIIEPPRRGTQPATEEKSHTARPVAQPASEEKRVAQVVKTAIDRPQIILSPPVQHAEMAERVHAAPTSASVAETPEKRQAQTAAAPLLAPAHAPTSASRHQTAVASTTHTTLPPRPTHQLGESAPSPRPVAPAPDELTPAERALRDELTEYFHGVWQQHGTAAFEPGKGRDFHEQMATKIIREALEKSPRDTRLDTDSAARYLAHQIMTHLPARLARLEQMRGREEELAAAREQPNDHDRLNKTRMRQALTLLATDEFEPATARLRHHPPSGPRGDAAAGARPHVKVHSR